MNSKQFFFCYDPSLAKHLKLNARINYITNAKHKDTGNEFWLFPKSDRLNDEVKYWRDECKNGNHHKR